MISTELLSEVLNENINSCWVRPNGIDLQYSLIEIIPHEPLSYINIYELAHKCKQWAKNHGYLLYSVPDLCIVKTFNLEHCVDFGLDTEIESIFRACQWILDKDSK